MDPTSGLSRRSAAIGLSAVSLILLAGCAAAGNDSAHGLPTSAGTASTGTASASTGPSGTGAGGTASAHRALLTAAVQSQRITSAVTTLDIRVTGAAATTERGTIRYRLKPALVMSEDLHITSPSQNTEIKAIVTRKDLYLSSPGQSLGPGKTWMKFSVAALKDSSNTSLASLAQLIQNLQSDNFTNQARLFTVAKNAHVVGTATIDGVPTTEYAGSFRASDAVKALPASLRKVLGPQLATLGDTVIGFHEWIDGQNHPRRVTEVETIQGNVVNTTVNITAINQPVRITLPPASQTTSSPTL